MANCNKVIIDGVTKIDLTVDSVTAADVAEGKTFHDASGTQKTGTKPATKLQSKSVTYTSNGTAIVTPDSGYDGLSQISVKVNVPDSGSELYNFTIINNLANSPVEYNIGDDIGVVPGGETVELTPSTLYNVLTNICIQFPIRYSYLSTYTDSSTSPKTIVFSIDPAD